MLAHNLNHGETIEALLESLGDYETKIESAKALEAEMRADRQILEGAVESARQRIAEALAESGEPSVATRHGLISFSTTPPKVVVVDESKIPEKFFVTSRSINKTLLGATLKSGEAIEGATLSNGGQTLVIKRK